MMADTDWRVFLFQTLSGYGPLLSLLPQPHPERYIFGAGRLTSSPDNKPFLVIRLDTESPAPIPGHSVATATLYAHDEPGDYMGTDALLRAARAVLAPNATGSQHPGGICKWAGDSGDLSDEVMKTQVKTSTYELFGKDGVE